MRVVIQKVKRATVEIEYSEERHMGYGLLVFLGIEDADNEEDILWLCKKIVSLRVFDDDQGVMNLSVLDVQGDIMLISQFTLHALVKKGNRPSYIRAARPEVATPLYDRFKKQLSIDLRKPVVTGEFGAHMDVKLVNDGPVTLFIDSKNKE